MDILYILLFVVVIFLQAVIVLKNRHFKSPVILMREGKLSAENMKSCRISSDDIAAAARRAGYFSLGDIDTAILEKNGEISLLPTPQKRRLNPKDFNFAPLREGISLTVFENGRLNSDNLKKIGFTEQKLNDFLTERGYRLNDARLIIISESGRVCVFD